MNWRLPLFFFLYSLTLVFTTVQIYKAKNILSLEICLIMSLIIYSFQLFFSPGILMGTLSCICSQRVSLIIQIDLGTKLQCQA